MSKERTNPDNNDEVYHDFNTKESIESLLSGGAKSYKEKKYVEELDQFTYAKELDANHENPSQRKNLSIIVTTSRV